MIRGTASSGSEPMYSSIAATYSSGAKRNTACLRSRAASTPLAALRATPPPRPTPVRAAAAAEAAVPGAPLAEPPPFVGARLLPPAPLPAGAEDDDGGGGDGAPAAPPKLPRRLYACPGIGSGPPLRR